MLTSFVQDITAGMGDYLNALSKFLVLAESKPGIKYSHLTSKTSIRTGNPETDRLFGLDALSDPIDDLQKYEHSDPRHITLRQFAQLVSSGFSDNCNDHLVVHFTPDDYTLNSNDFLDDSSSCSYISSRLQSALHASPIVLKAKELRSSLLDGCDEIICLHVRRGDIAFVDLRKHGPIYSGLSDKAIFYYSHTNCLYQDSDLEASSLPQGFRFLRSSQYYKGLTQYLASLGNQKTKVILISDGFTHAAHGLSHYCHALSASQIEEELTNDLSQLIAASDISVLGETPDKFELSLAYIIAADTVIYGPSCLPLTIKQLINFPANHKIVDVSI